MVATGGFLIALKETAELAEVHEWSSPSHLVLVLVSLATGHGQPHRCGTQTNGRGRVATGPHGFLHRRPSLLGSADQAGMHANARPCRTAGSIRSVVTGLIRGLCQAEVDERSA